MVGQPILMVRVLWDAHQISLQNREKTGNFALFFPISRPFICYYFYLSV